MLFILSGLQQPAAPVVRMSLRERRVLGRRVD
jgi:hypothetical protein